ncbi:YceI family protein [Seohaeicola saemankumensis]|nr:YceI family protein [Seohaeicola saemankumensis]MCA0870074.1 YceI family protein [Seohaeicola saemankumensis]
MIPITRRNTLAILAALALPAPLAARPQRYVLDTEGSRVAFVFRLAGINHTGTMPVRAADITVDPANLAASRVDVRLDSAGARTGLDYATAALKGPGILDVANHPQIRFQSTRVRLGAAGRISDGARLEGLLTLRGITRPIRLEAALYRLPGSAPDDLSRLTVALKGQLSRASFGATGYADLVADTVALDILAKIRATG